MALTGCNPTTKKDQWYRRPNNHTDKSITPVDTTPKGTGIGGVFFYLDNPKETQE